MASTEIKCANCGKKHLRHNGHINRSRAIGAPLYCGRECAGQGRRDTRTIAEKKQAKHLYDMEYRKTNRDILKAKKSAYYQRTHDPVKEAAIRKARMHLHVEYCRRPEYKAWKEEYDRQYRAKQEAGEFWESKILILKIEKELDAKMNRYERSIEKGNYNKSQFRRRDYEKLNCN